MKYIQVTVTETVSEHLVALSGGDLFRYTRLPSCKAATLLERAASRFRKLSADEQQGVERRYGGKLGGFRFEFQVEDSLSAILWSIQEKVDTWATAMLLEWQVQEPE